AGAVARALWTLSWPLALLGKPSELRLRGPNHGEGAPTFHDLRLGWAPCAARFGLKIRLELTQAGFGTDEGEIVALLDPAPALTAFRAVHRGILRQVTVVAAVGGGRYEAAQEAAQQVVRAMRRRGVIAEAERVPLPLPSSSTARCRCAPWWTERREKRVWWRWRRRHDRAALRGGLRSDPLRRARRRRDRVAVVPGGRRDPRRQHRRRRRSFSGKDETAGRAAGSGDRARVHRSPRAERAQRADRSPRGVEGP